MVTLRVESLHGVRGVIDNLQLALLVIVAISAVKDTICVSCLVTELTVISGEEESFHKLWIILEKYPVPVSYPNL